MLALGTPGFDIRRDFGGTTILCESDAINARAGDQSCLEAKSFCSPPQSFCRAGAKQERRSEVQLSASNQGEWKCSPRDRIRRRRNTSRGTWELSINRAGTIEAALCRSRLCYLVYRGSGFRAASHSA